MANKPNAEDIFTFTGQIRYWSDPSSDRSSCSLSDIYYTSSSPTIEPRAHTTECPILRGELMLAMARGCVVDLPLYVFLTLWSEAKITSSAGLLYVLLLTQFLHSVGCMDNLDEEKKASICPICWTTVSHSEE
ncbi:hypothetical protein CJ030_MR4G007295 [Morella rubra]|uniref:Uncharacterized protein n=1 Tax=Morella rubra TaxID=262757 RepID=A0A6A1VUN8_9ROSI|nr:hypothetical protein CJ030_MR4G007295 [Morella rubra]